MDKLGKRSAIEARKIGEYWERQFCILGFKHGKAFTAHQWGRKEKAALFYVPGLNPLTLPDITIWSAPGEHHEIKHKTTNQHGCYGLEDYRLLALEKFARETKQFVYYTIHDWKLAGAESADQITENNIEHWRFMNVLYMRKNITKSGNEQETFYNGKYVKKLIHYWEADLFAPLKVLWNG